MSELASGVVLQPVDDPKTFGAMTEEVEQLGYDHLWLTDSPCTLATATPI